MKDMVKIRKPVLLKIHDSSDAESFSECIFPITSKILKILTEDIESICGLGSELQIFTIYSIGILNILEVIAKMSLSKIVKCLTLFGRIFRITSKILRIPTEHIE